MIPTVFSQLLLPLFIFGHLLSSPAGQHGAWSCQLEARDVHLVVCRSDFSGNPVWLTIVRSSTQAVGEPLTSWQAWANTSTDAYIFSTPTPAEARLILSFSTTPDGVEQARIYLKDLGQSPLEYSITDGVVYVRSNAGKPYLVMVPTSGKTWVADGVTNYNLSLSIDGKLKASSFDWMQTDGIPDSIIKVGGTPSGTPAWQYSHLVNDPHPDWGYPRFGVNSRMDPASEFFVHAPLLEQFPYFCLGNESLNWFVENPCPLYFDLRTYTFTIFSFAGFQNGGMYDINSIFQPPDVNFEAPFVFYDLDPTNRHSELAIRVSHFKVADLLSIKSNLPAINDIRYSWKLESPALWQYALHLGGLYDYQDLQEIGGARFWGVSGAELPGWVMKKAWPVTMFIEVEQGYPGSEGIYHYSTGIPEVWDWITGSSSTQPTYLADPIITTTIDLNANSPYSLPPGFRGEYNAIYPNPPRLYYSPVDHLLHLLDASGGTENLEGGSVLKYLNLDHGSYIDGWRRESALPSSSADPRIVEELFKVGSTFLYSSTDQVRAILSAVPESQFELSPPTDAASWQAFKRAMAEAPLRKDPYNLSSWLLDIGEEVMLLNHATITAPEYADGKYRFELVLKPGYQLSGQDLFGIYQVPAAHFLVSFDGTSFHLQPLTPSNIRLTITAQLADSLDPSALYRVKLLAANSGSQDSTSQDISLVTDCAGKIQELLRTSALVLGNGQVSWAVMWQPIPTADCQLLAVLSDASGKTLTQASLDVPSVANQGSLFGQLLDSSTENGWTLPVFSLLPLLGCLIALCFWLFNRRVTPDS